MAGKRNIPLSILLYAGLAFWLVIASLPVVWTAIISFRQYVDAFSSPIKWIAPFTFDNYTRLWIGQEFYRNFLNTALVTVFTVTISLTVGCLAGYALSRYRGAMGFWLLLVALMFRAIPHSSLLPSFFTIFDALGIRNTYFTLIFVLVAINQPFTIWMLRSFFVNIPNELDEAALVDGCTRFQAFRRVIIPVMWPGVVTTGLFSFLLAYNDFLLSSALTSGDHMTMPAAIANAITAETEAFLMQGVAGAVSITIPLIILVVVFQKQIVGGLTQGAVKG
ncbi:MAG: carbohydrate ABC transporter permease [Rhodoferax sp.]|nr:carbohydrate ABC transporter permease [Rhodoferax sp.]HQX59112.1 carbohydrate ABC transporter permease [Burkholderiaceae bacterium]HQZ07293.1 carbohydrate ABC transporter permease [Burkholderiaceae bacterium]